ncbi:uncharacterized protein LOC106136735 [Amyelois transitella]|uniref:uncharacterized protein LOC106136735 n=1 Tax=Amyelois transitella TaxID=680683 RepID=UPI00298F8BC0|nr:uncharacterized protein LOC106136735 [Amyelois transitella]
MERSSLEEIEVLAQCACCKCVFDEERPPKLLACHHHFCLRCVGSVLRRGRDVCCLLCARRTELSARLPTHRPVLALARRLAPPELCAAHALPQLWCGACGQRACRACAAHRAHELRPRAALLADGRALRAELLRAAARRRELQLRALDAATALKLALEAELAAPPPAAPPAPATLAAAAAQCSRLRERSAAAALRARLDDLVRSAAGPIDAHVLRRAGLPCDAPPPEPGDPLLLLANYCTAQLYWRGALAADADALVRIEETQEAAEDAASSASTSRAGASPSSPLRPGSLPLYYFELEVDGAAFGRVVIEVRGDVAPRMARNFDALASGAPGAGYRGCAVFQCWENESVITGDFELNNGRGGRSAFAESYFMPDDTRLAAVRGAVGMRRSQKRHDNLGLVGSQFRIVLREMRGFTAIFASVVEGLELVDRLARTGDSAGKPHSAILIAGCGRLD